METSISLIDAFEDHEYERKVLQLQDGHTEGDVERQHEQDAATLGVDTAPITHPESNHHPTLLPPPASSYGSSYDCPSATSSINTFRRSLSNESRRTCSTGLTLPSRRSRESNLVLPISPLTPHDEHRPSSFSRPPPLTLVDSVPASPTSLTSPTPSLRLESTKPSPPLATPRRFASRLGLNRLAKLKRPSTSYPRSETPKCRLCPFTSSQPECVYRLNCDHSLCAKHLSTLVLDTKKGRDSQRLKCCNESIPSIAAYSIIQKNMREQPLKSHPAPTPPELKVSTAVVLPLPPSRAGDGFDSQSCRGRSQSRHRSSHNSLMFFPADHLATNLERAMKQPAFKHMRMQQHEERERFVSFQSEKECSLRAQQAKDMEALRGLQEQHRRDLSDKHPQELATLEDTHISAELELLEHHSLESRNCLTALRHMEGYCKGGQDPSGAERVVTLQDRVKLERQYWRWKNLERKQASAINVMRERQARQLKTRSLKQVSELSALQEAQEKEMRESEATHAAEVEELRGRFERRKRRLIRRWDIATDTWKARCEGASQDSDEHDRVPYPVLPVEWPA